MKFKEIFLHEFDHEMITTKKALERIPADTFGWKPHEKSMTMGVLVSHIADIPSWAVLSIEHDTLDLAPPGAPPYVTPLAASTKELLEMFEKNSADAREAINTADEDRLQQNWTLLMGGRIILTMPRTAVIRGYVMNHLIHHRGQLSVFMRLKDIPVPAIYGPSADEGTF